MIEDLISSISQEDNDKLSAQQQALAERAKKVADFADKAKLAFKDIINPLIERTIASMKAAGWSASKERSLHKTGYMGATQLATLFFAYQGITAQIEFYHLSTSTTINTDIQLLPKNAIKLVTRSFAETELSESEIEKWLTGVIHSILRPK